MTEQNKMKCLCAKECTNKECNKEYNPKCLKYREWFKYNQNASMISHTRALTANPF